MLNDALRSEHEEEEVCRNARVDLVPVESGGDVLRPVIEFFARRKRRMTR